MARVPAAGVMVTSPKDPAVLKAEEEQRRKAIEQLPGAAVEGAYAIASGAIKPLVGLVAIDTEGAASSDDLDRMTGEPNQTLTGFPVNGIVIVRAANTARTVVLKHEAGGSYDLSLAPGVDFALDDDRKSVAFQLRGTRWYEIVRDYGADQAARRADLGLTLVATLANPTTPGDDGKFVGANSGAVAWTSAPSGGDGFLAKSLQHPASGRNYASGSPVRFELIDVGTASADGFQFFAPAGATLCRVQCLAQIERQNENANYDFVTLRVVETGITLPGVYDETGAYGARGMPSRSVFYRPQSESDRLKDPYVVVASNVIAVTHNGAIRVQVEGLSANSYRVKGEKARSWLSIQWM